MSETIATAGVPEVTMGSGIPAGSSSVVPPTFSGAWGDMEKDMAAIAAEMGQTPAQPEATQPAPAAATEVPPTQNATEAVKAPEVVPPVAAAPVVPEAKPAPEVPDKFRGLDGKLDQEKLLKSYFDAEKALKRAQNAKPADLGPTAIAPTQPVPQSQPTAPVPANLSPFELQVAQDIYSQGGFTEQQAVAQARVMVKLMEAKHKADTAATFSEVNQFREALAQQAQRAELESLASLHPEVLTPQGFEELNRVRQENPWLNASPEPWKAATAILLGQKSLKGQAQSVSVPTPKGAQNAAAPLPATPAAPAKSPVVLSTPEQVLNYVKNLSPEEEGKFWKAQGLKWESSPGYKGI